MSFGTKFVVSHVGVSPTHRTASHDHTGTLVMILFAQRRDEHEGSTRRAAGGASRDDAVQVVVECRSALWLRSRTRRVVH